MAGGDDELLERVRSVCLDLPEVTERPSHGTPAFFVRDKATFVYAWIGGHHDHEFPHLWCAAPEGMQAARLAGGDPRWFRPPYVGHRGWIGLRLDGPVDWDEVADLVEDAYRAVAPKRLLALLDPPAQP
ncbi:MAG: MmcQ/YjbR family DNA-binding protein [Acidimicrobiia bacterium]